MRDGVLTITGDSVRHHRRHVVGRRTALRPVGGPRPGARRRPVVQRAAAAVARRRELARGRRDRLHGDRRPGPAGGGRLPALRRGQRAEARKGEDRRHPLAQLGGRVDTHVRSPRSWTAGSGTAPRTSAVQPPGPMHLCIQLDWFPSGSGTVRESTMQVDWVREYDLEPRRLTGRLSQRGFSRMGLLSTGCPSCTSAPPPRTVPPRDRAAAGSRSSSWPVSPSPPWSPCWSSPCGATTTAVAAAPEAATSRRRASRWTRRSGSTPRPPSATAGRLMRARRVRRRRLDEDSGRPTAAGPPTTSASTTRTTSPSPTARQAHQPRRPDLRRHVVGRRTAVRPVGGPRPVAGRHRLRPGRAAVARRPTTGPRTARSTSWRSRRATGTKAHFTVHWGEDNEQDTRSPRPATSPSGTTSRSSGPRITSSATWTASSVYRNEDQRRAAAGPDALRAFSRTSALRQRWIPAPDDDARRLGHLRGRLGAHLRP